VTGKQCLCISPQTTSFCMASSFICLEVNCKVTLTGLENTFKVRERLHCNSMQGCFTYAPYGTIRHSN